MATKRSKGKRVPIGHVTRISDSSLYDEVCVNCGATDGLDDSLARPCPKAAPPVQGAQEDELPSGEPSQEELDKWADPAFMGWYRKFAHWDSKEEAFKAWEQAHLAASPVQGAQDSPGTLRLTCGCVSHLCEQHQKEIAAPPVQTSGMTELVHAVTQYAIKKGEAWRVGEGTEIMDALCHQGGVTTAAIPPNTYRGFNGETCELKTSMGQQPVQGAHYDYVVADDPVQGAGAPTEAAQEKLCNHPTLRLMDNKEYRCTECGTYFTFSTDVHKTHKLLESAMVHQSPVEALRVGYEAMKGVAETVGFYLKREANSPANHQEFAQEAENKLHKFNKAIDTLRALAAQEKPPQMSVRYCGHEAPVGKACPVCFPGHSAAQEKGGEL